MLPRLPEETRATARGAQAMDHRVSQILVNAHIISYTPTTSLSNSEMSSSSDSKAINSYRKVVVDLLDTNFSKLNSVLEGCLEVFARKAFEAKLISEQVMKDKNFTGMINEFKAGMEWCGNTLEIQSRCTVFLKILESLGGPAEIAGQDLYVKLLILDGR